MKRAWIAFVVAASAAGCAEAPESPTTTDTESLGVGDAASTSKQVFERLLKAAEAQRSQRASQAGFVASVDAFAAHDIVYSIAGHPLVRGKADVAALLDSIDPSHAQRATFEPRRITVSADGLLGATFGWNTFTTTATDGTTKVTYGSYTTMWRRTGLRWTEIVHVANAVATPPTEAPADFPLLDPTAPVVRLGAPDDVADEVAALDLQFAAASVAQGGAVAIPAYAAATSAEAIYGGVDYGYDQVAAAHANDYPPSVAALDWWPSDQGATFTGDLGYTDGIYVVRLASNNQVVAQGTYLTVYQRQTDGTWKFILANSNASPISP